MPDRETMAGAAVRSRRRKKQRLTTGQKLALIFSVLIVLGGAAALAYPEFSQWWNARDQSSVVTDYAQEIGCLDDTDAQEQLRRARDYNRNLTDVVAASDPFTSEGTMDPTEYNTLLWATQEGVMAYVEIPKIGVLLPIYHGVGSDVLMKGVGHLPETSLPVGGESTHCVLAGHSGMTHGSHALYITNQLDLSYNRRKKDRRLPYERENPGKWLRAKDHRSPAQRDLAKYQWRQIQYHGHRLGTSRRGVKQAHLRSVCPGASLYQGAVGQNRRVHHQCSAGAVHPGDHKDLRVPVNVC